MSNFKLISVTDGWGICCEIALRWFPLDLTDDKLSIGLGTGFVLPGKKSLPEPDVSKLQFESFQKSFQIIRLFHRFLTHP